MLTTLALNVSAQDRSMRIGFHASPLISWINSNNNLILKTGGNLGLKIGTTADIYFKENYSFTVGINLAFNEGGEFLYENRGSYLPKSDLSDPATLQIGDAGDPPMPDGTKIRYGLQYVELPIGLKIRSKEIGYIRYFVEAPVFNLAFLTRGRGDIESSAFPKFEGENIYKDLSVFNVFWGLGAGIEYSISENNALIGGLYYQNGLIDFTRDHGWSTGTSTDGQIIQVKEDSRSTVSNIMLKLGILF